MTKNCSQYAEFNISNITGIVLVILICHFLSLHDNIGSRQLHRSFLYAGAHNIRPQKVRSSCSRPRLHTVTSKHFSWKCTLVQAQKADKSRISHQPLAGFPA